MAAVTVEIVTRFGLVRIRACGEAAALVEVRAGDDEANWRAAHHIAAELTGSGWLGTIATYDSVLVEYDPVQVDLDLVIERVRNAAETGQAPELRPQRRLLVPVVYGGEHGPDLEAAAAELGLEPAELVRRHHAQPYLIRCVVSPAGAPMTDGPALPGGLRRRASPRVAVAAGSVALAGRQGMVYASPAPGGWQLIGRTPVRLIDPYRSPPVGYRPGDLLQYLPLPAARWDELAGTAAEIVDG